MALTRINNNSLSSVTAAGLPIYEGQVLQVVSDTVTAPTTINPGTTFTAYPDLAATITPTSASSKIYVSAYCAWSAATVNQDVMIRIARNGSGVFVGDSRNSNVRSAHGVGDAVDKVHASWGSVIFSTTFLDEPEATVAQTYTIQFLSGFAQSGIVYLGQSAVGPAVTSGEQFTAPATITLMEIAGA